MEYEGRLTLEFSEYGTTPRELPSQHHARSCLAGGSAKEYALKEADLRRRGLWEGAGNHSACNPYREGGEGMGMGMG